MSRQHSLLIPLTFILLLSLRKFASTVCPASEINSWASSWTPHPPSSSIFQFIIVIIVSFLNIPQMCPLLQTSISTALVQVVIVCDLGFCLGDSLYSLASFPFSVISSPDQSKKKLVLMPILGHCPTLSTSKAFYPPRIKTQFLHINYMAKRGYLPLPACLA